MPKSETFEMIALSSNTIDHHKGKMLATDPASRKREPVTSWADTREVELPRLTLATMDVISKAHLVHPNRDRRTGDPVLPLRDK